MTQEIISYKEWFLPTFFMLVLLISPLSGNAASITQFDVQQLDGKTQVIFNLSDPVTPIIFKLNKPRRLVVDLPNTKSSSTLKTNTNTNSHITKIRHAIRPNKAFRVVFDLSEQVTYSHESIAIDSMHQIILTLSTAVSKSTPAAAPEKAPPIETKPAAPEPEKAPPPVKPSQPEEKPDTAPPVVEETPPPQQVEVPPVIIENAPDPEAIATNKPTEKRNILIAIDAGHGGKDHGAKGQNGTKEKVVTLEIARRLAKLIDAEPGMHAYLTRDNDTFVSLRGRIQRARKQKADMFISIHADGFHDKRARGSSVFVLSERGASSEAAKLIADKENAADLIGGVSLDDKDDMLVSILVDLSQNASLEASYEVAGTILSGLQRIGNVHKKKIEAAGFAVLKSPDIPSVLVETAFITNPNEEKKLRSASHQNKLARAILTGIRTYFRNNPLPFADPIPQQHIVSSGESLGLIAQRYRVTITALKKINNLRNNKILIGQTLRIP